jgi:hypothetical protein
MQVVGIFKLVNLEISLLIHIGGLHGKSFNVYHNDFH